MQKRITLVITGILSFLLWMPFLFAQDVIESNGSLGIEAQVNAVHERIDALLAETQDTKQLVEFEKQLSQLSSQIDVCIDSDKLEVDKLTKRLEALGDPVVGDTDDIIELRESLSTEIGNVRSLAQTCRDLKDANDTRRQLIENKQRTLNTEILTRRSITLKDSIANASGSYSVWASDIKESFFLNPEVGRSKSSWGIGLFFAILGLGIGLLLRHRFTKQLSQYSQPGGKEPFELNLLKSLNHFIPYLLTGLLGFLAFKNVSELHNGWTLPTRLACIACIYGIVGAYFQWFCKPHSPGDELHTLHKDIPKALVKRMQVVSLIVAAGFAIFGTQFLQSIPKSELTFPYQILLFILALAMLSTLQLSSEFPDLKGRSRFLRLFLMLATFIALPAILFGYLNAANFLLFAVLVTQTAVLVLRTLMWSIEVIFDGIVNGKTKASYKMRASLGIRAEESSTELSWLRLFLGLGLWIFFVLVILIVWDYTDSVIPNLQEFTNEGFQIGDEARLVPRNILAGIITFAVVQAITIWFKARMERQWLRSIGMERGARDALVTLMGYLGMIIAILMGMTAAGVSFSGLALVAGALSVGIGFGLQNIVNNFISGLILLFERPINNGDYISVNNVEGTVKRISIRSTEIETLHRTNVIVPNSELISGQVTNWVLHDANGVIQVPVGVAYGTNTELVKELLLNIAKEHQEVVTRPNMPQPKVRFSGFGDNSLDFVLVVLIKNINNRFEVISDLNFMIDKTFRDNQIEIPFPQRDLHIKADTHNALPAPQSVAVNIENDNVTNRESSKDN